MSRIDTRPIPFEIKPLIAASRPEPTPFTTADPSLMPIVCAFWESVSPTFAAAKGVPFFAPRKPREPLEDQHRVFPFTSVSTTFVLLYVDSTQRTPTSALFLETEETEGLSSLFSLPSSFAT